MTLAPAGGSAQPGGVWSTSNPAVVGLTQAPDGLSCVVRSLGPIGEASVFWTGMARVKDGTLRSSGGVATVRVVFGPGFIEVPLAKVG